jgi:hypothetical protein
MSSAITLIFLCPNTKEKAMKYGGKSGKSATARGRGTAAKYPGAKVVSGVVQGPVNSPEPGVKKAGKMPYAKPGAKSAERTANRA